MTISAGDSPRETPLAVGLVPDPDVTMLERIRELSINARTTWIGLLAVLAFVGVTLMGHRDADFFARGAETQLPLINVAVPPEAFFWVAPLLLAAVYAYLQLFLVTLWDALGEAPDHLQGQPLGEAIFPWLLSQSAVWVRRRLRGDASMPVRSMAGITALISVGLTWLAAPVVLGFLWERSQALHDARLTLWVAACLGVALVVGLRALWVMLRRMGPASRAEAHRLPVWQVLVPLLALPALALVSVERSEGAGTGLMTLRKADLTEARLTPRPDDWKPFELWLADYRRERGKPVGDGASVPDKQELARWELVIASLDAPALKGRNLRGAVAAQSFLPGSDLRQADLAGADFSGARLQGVLLDNAALADASFDFALLQGAAMYGVDMPRASFEGARMQGVSMQSAAAPEAALMGAGLQSAYLREIDLTGAYANAADFSAADLQDAVLTGADVRAAVYDGAYLVYTDLSEASCSGMSLVGTILDGTSLNCEGLRSEDLRFAVGDMETVLPRGIALRSCLERERLPDTVRARIAVLATLMPETGNRFRYSGAEYLDRVFCEPGEAPERVGQSP